jgi:hypothetical protein
MILHKIRNIYFNPSTYINKNFSFEHLDEQQSQKAKEYLIECVTLFEQDNLIFSKEIYNFLQCDNIKSVLDRYDENLVYAIDNAYYFEDLNLQQEENKKHKQNISIFKKYFINKYLPPKRLEEKNIVVHIRLGDAINTDRKISLSKFNDNLVKLIRIFDVKFPEHRIYLHTDGNVDLLEKENITVFTKDENILYVLSDFIHATIFVANNSSLSEVSCFFGEKKLIIVNDEAKTSKPENTIKMSDYINLNQIYLEEGANV